MKNETITYPFTEKIMFVSEGEAGICYLSYKIIIIEIDGKIQKFTHSNCFQEGYVLNSEKVLLIENQLMGQVQDLFSFKLVIFNLSTKKAEIIKTFQFSDYRGVKIKKDHIVIGLNNYDPDLLSHLDPDGLGHNPPCSDCTVCSEVINLDLNLNVINSKVYDNYIPDDLILFFGGAGENEMIIFNNSLLKGMDHVVCQLGETNYAVRDRKHFLRVNNDGVSNEIYSTDQIIIGVGLSIQSSFPVFRLYQNDKVEILSLENSLRFILS
jgi:hypothetical protein